MKGGSKVNDINNLLTLDGLFAKIAMIWAHVKFTNFCNAKVGKEFGTFFFIWGPNKYIVIAQIYYFYPF